MVFAVSDQLFFLSLAFTCMSDTHTKTTHALVSGQRGELELGDVHFRRAAATAAAVSVPEVEERGIKMSITA